MNSPEDKNDLQRRERELQEREQAIRLRELEAELYQQQPPLFPTAKHEATERSPKRWYKKLGNMGKFFLLVIAVVVSVKIASWLAGAVIIGAIALIAYKLFFESDRAKS